MLLCVYVNVCMCMHMYICTMQHEYTYERMYVYSCMCMYSYGCCNIFIYMRAHTYYTCTYIHTCNIWTVCKCTYVILYLMDIHTHVSPILLTCTYGLSGSLTQRTWSFGLFSVMEYFIEDVSVLKMFLTYFCPTFFLLSSFMNFRSVWTHTTFITKRNEGQ